MLCIIVLILFCSINVYKYHCNMLHLDNKVPLFSYRKLNGRSLELLNLICLKLMTISVTGVSYSILLSFKIPLSISIISLFSSRRKHNTLHLIDKYINIYIRDILYTFHFTSILISMWNIYYCRKHFINYCLWRFHFIRCKKCMFGKEHFSSWIMFSFQKQGIVVRRSTQVH